MQLIERDEFLALLQSKFKEVAAGEGKSVFINGEAGIGKTSLVNAFCNELKGDSKVLRGTCDYLFTPRPLAPLYDIAQQIKINLTPPTGTTEDRASLFSRFFHELASPQDAVVLVFEDIHWADEATLDFIKFFARRITQIKCLFILTYRDDEVHSRHPLRNVLGQLNPDTFTRIQLPALSKSAVAKMATQRGYNGEDVYAVSGGNPFYVQEILASYSVGVPDNIKDSILSVYNNMKETTRQVWDILSMFPSGLSIKYLEKIEPHYAAALEQCLEARIIIIKDSSLRFKHELYRRTIEGSLSPLLRVSLNKRIIELFRESFERDKKIEQLIHHAKNANDYELVVHYAPISAKEAAAVGAHLEASKLYQTAIEYYQGSDDEILLRFYEAYAYECYLTNQIKEAIIYTGKALELWTKKNDKEKIGNSLRFLSRLWWFDGNGRLADSYGMRAIEILKDQPSSKSKAMAYSNMSQIKMLSERSDECILWGTKAIAIAEELSDEETLAHALNNVGTMKLKTNSLSVEGHELLQRSLDISLKNSFQEQVARAYTNLSSNAVANKRYQFAEEKLVAGILYSDEHDLDPWKTYMLSWLARLKLETGHWQEAHNIATNLLRNESQSPVVKIGTLEVIAAIKMRKGEEGALSLLRDAKTKAFDMMEPQRVVPAVTLMLEYEWLTGELVIDKEALEAGIRMAIERNNAFESNAFSYWLRKARNQHFAPPIIHEAYDLTSEKKVHAAIAFWARCGCPYEEAIISFEGDDDDKRKAVTTILELGATAVFEKMKLSMRTSGIRNIPRGIRKSTRSNPALLTDRELDVLQLLNEGIQNKEIAARLFISAKTVDHHISSILFKLDAKSRTKAVQEAIRLNILK